MDSTTAERPRRKPILRQACLVVLFLLPSVLLMVLPCPWHAPLRGMGRGTLVPLLVFAVIGLFRLFRKTTSVLWWEWGAITLCFALLQAYIFNTALHPGNHFNLIGGLLPNADPSMYLSLASQWERGLRVVTPQTTRQFFPCFLAAMLWICHHDIKAIVSIFTLVTGGVLFFAWAQVRLLLGWIGSTLFAASVFFFYRAECLGLLRTEQLGLWFSLIAIALMLKGIASKREWFWNFGVFSLVMGLNTRAGAYFVLPLFVLYSGCLFRKGRWGWQSIALTLATVVAGVLLNLGCYWVFFAPPRPTSNFWLCFYGMLKGGNWVTALHEIGLDFLRTNLIARSRALTLLRADPWLVVRGFFRACQYVWRTNTFYLQPPTNPVFCDVLKWLSCIGAILPATVAMLRKRRAGIEIMVLLSALGVVASLPFAPPWDGGFRVFAVTDPFLYLAPALLVSILEKTLVTLCWAPLPTSSSIIDGRVLPVLAEWSMIILSSLSIFVPLGLMLRPKDKSIVWEPGYCVPPPQGCPADKLPEGFQIHLIPDSGQTFVPWVRVSDFRASIKGNLEVLRAPWILELFRELPAGTTIATAFHSNFFVISTEKAESKRWSWRNPILNRQWHRITYDGDYPIPPRSRRILSLPAPPPLPQRPPAKPPSPSR